MYLTYHTMYYHTSACVLVCVYMSTTCIIYITIYILYNVLPYQ